MIANGASLIFAANVNATATHTECVSPALVSALFFFSAYQNIEDVSSSYEVSFDLPFEIFPNPVSNNLTIKGLPENGNMNLLDMNGRVIFNANLAEGDQDIDLSLVGNGLYVLQIFGKETVWQQKLVVR